MHLHCLLVTVQMIAGPKGERGVDGVTAQCNCSWANASEQPHAQLPQSTGVVPVCI